MSNRLPKIFILINVMIDSMGIGLIMPVMPDLIQELEAGDLGQAAVWGGILAAIFAVMQFLFGPVIGGLSDRFGRRPVLLTDGRIRHARAILGGCVSGYGQCDLWLFRAA